jgi:DNA repair protein RecN (Recombination protein N)
MGRARFAVSIGQTEEPDGVPIPGPDGSSRRVAVDLTGTDRVEFLIAPNAGEALKPLGRVASGGEMARLMLALKSILSEADATPTLIFDEVDVGVGGRSGQLVGEKLWGLAAGHQVLVITHLPQIAAFADAHFQIRKDERDGRATSSVAPLADERRIVELAAMLDGLPVTNASREKAIEMLRRVELWKAEHRPGSRAIGAEPVEVEPNPSARGSRSG